MLGNISKEKEINKEVVLRYAKEFEYLKNN